MTAVIPERSWLQLPPRTLNAVRPRRVRFRERDFWSTQGLVALATLAVYGFDVVIRGDVAKSAVVAGGLHDIPIMFYLVPVMYAALVYGFEGAVLTALWSTLLTMPHTLIQSHARFEWVGDAGTMTTILIAGAFLAYRTEREREARWRAEAVSERLGLLNDLGDVFDRSAEVVPLLQGLANRLAEGLRLDGAWVRFGTDGDGRSPLLITASGERVSRAIDAAAAAWVTDRARAGGTVRQVAAGWVVAPLISEGRFMGALGASRSRPPLAAGEIEVLGAAAAQASVALENLELQRERREALTSYARRVTSAQEDERRRIARELHDGVTQALSGLCRGLDVLRAESSAHDRATGEAVTDLRAVAEQALVDLRRMTRDLRPTVLDDLGLIPALEWQATDLRERSGLRVTLDCCCVPEGLSGEQELCVFRIVQEALSNVEKHARATSVSVDVECSDDAVRVEVADDGTGIEGPRDPAAFAREGRYGMLGMQERAALHSGTLTVHSNDRGGTTVMLEMRPAGVA